MKKIAFLMRYDYLEKGGGDVIQIKNYIPHLELHGYQCELLDDLNLYNVYDFDIFILVNIDRPVETINYFRFLKKNSPNKKVFLIPIHHPIDAINKFEKEKKGVLFRFFSIVLPDFYSREKFKNFVRVFRYPKMIPLAFQHVFINYRSVIKKLILSVDGIVFISDGERKSIEKDFRCAPQSFCISYNAVEMDFPVESLTPKVTDIIIVGRIEPRKNQLNVAKILASMDITAIFIGPKNNNNNYYFDAFTNIINTSSNIDYLGPMEHSKVLEYLKRSRILLNASYFEVNPLVDLEAALVGCGVVTTKYSYSIESLPNVIEIDPWLDDSIIDGLNKALESPKNTILNKNINSSWRASVEPILELIQKCS